MMQYETEANYRHTQFHQRAKQHNLAKQYEKDHDNHKSERKTTTGRLLNIVLNLLGITR